MPRHPAYNSLEKGSSRYGFERLILALTKYRLWDLALTLEESVWLDPGTEEKLKRDKQRLMIMAAYGCGLIEKGDKALAEFETKHRTLEAEVQKWKEEPPAPSDPTSIPEDRKTYFEAYQAMRNRAKEELERSERREPKVGSMDRRMPIASACPSWILCRSHCGIGEGEGTRLGDRSRMAGSSWPS